MAVTLRYFTEFGKLRIYARSTVFLVSVQCRRKESSRSLSHLLMSFLSLYITDCILYCPAWRYKKSQWWRGVYPMGALIIGAISSELALSGQICILLFELLNPLRYINSRQ